MELRADIEQILLRKSFAELTDEELAVITPYFDQATYEQYRLVLIGSSALQQTNPLPNPDLEQRLLTAFDQQYASLPTEPFVSRILSHRIPSWLAGGVAACLCLFSILLSSEKPDPVVTTETEVVYQTDTVYIEIPMAQQLEDNAPQIAKNVRKARVKREFNKESTPKPIAQNTMSPKTSEHAEHSIKSSSVQRDQDLLDLVVKVY